MYSMTPDSHFVIDRSQVDGRIVYAAGLSDTFKFTAALGEVLADMASEESPAFDLSLFQRSAD